MQGVHSPSSCFHSTDPPSNQSIQELSNQPAIHNVMNMPFFPQEALQNVQTFLVSSRFACWRPGHLSLRLSLMRRKLRKFQSQQLPTNHPGASPWFSFIPTAPLNLTNLHLLNKCMMAPQCYVMKNHNLKSYLFCVKMSSSSDQFKCFLGP